MENNGNIENEIIFNNNNNFILENNNNSIDSSNFNNNNVNNNLNINNNSSNNPTNNKNNLYYYYNFKDYSLNSDNDSSITSDEEEYINGLTDSEESDSDSDMDYLNDEEIDFFLQQRRQNFANLGVFHEIMLTEDFGQSLQTQNNI